jgi:hypothetical protein
MNLDIPKIINKKDDNILYQKFKILSKTKDKIYIISCKLYRDLKYLLNF